MKLIKTALVIAAAIVYSAMPAGASTVYDWTVAAAGFNGGGTVTLGAADDGGYLATSITGAIDIDTNGTTTDQTITGLATSGGFVSVDNIVYPSGATFGYLDGTGLGVTLANGLAVKVRDISGQNYNATSYDTAGALNGYSGVTFDVTPVPLPPTWVMMIAGLLALGFVAPSWRKISPRWPCSSRLRN
jgi:hypothetical protein